MRPLLLPSTSLTIHFSHIILPFGVSIFRVPATVMKKAASVCACYLIYDGLLLELFFELEDGGDMFFRKVG
jgi:hypothetical protein